MLQRRMGRQVDEWTDGRTERPTQIHRTLMATAGDPKRLLRLRDNRTTSIWPVTFKHHQIYKIFKCLKT